jgi:potassium-transporting ATPase KdpC subunit
MNRPEPRLVSLLRPALVLLALLTIITGFIYPLVVTAIAQGLFANKANGSLIVEGGRTLGSQLIGQSFSDPRDFWGRPSASTPQPYNGTASGGSNLGPLNPDLLDAVKARVAALRAADPGNHDPVPVDLVTTSGSGLDPDISVAAANYQAARVARARGLSVDNVRALIDAHAQRRAFGLFGEPRVNVLELNLALDQLK